MTTQAVCTHPATLSVAFRPGVRWCPTCGAHLLEQDDGSLLVEVTGR